MNAGRRSVKIAAASALVGGLAALGAPAMATTSSSLVPVTFASAAGCTSCRTLVLMNPDGTPLTGLNMSSGASGFIAEVKDSGIDPAALGNFSVGSTMSNLYQYDSKTGLYNCQVSIPSNQLNLNSAPSLLNASNLSASLQPVFRITGDLSGILTTAVTSLLPTLTIVTNPVITAQGETDTALTQTVEAGGSTLSSLTGSLLSNLPIGLTTGTGGPFAVPAAPPAGSNCSGTGSGATSIPVLNGVLPASSPLLAEVQSVVGNPTVTQLISSGYLDSQTAENLISVATGVPESEFNTGGLLSGLLGPIEDTLTGTVTGVVDSATTLTGNYSAEPATTINAPSATPATYQGVMTVTLVDSGA